MRQQLPDPTLRLSRQAGEDVLQVGEGLMPIQARSEPAKSQFLRLC